MRQTCVQGTGCDTQLEKCRLECEKLRAEIDQARTAWWKRPGYLGALAPIVLAAAGLFSAWITGFFDTQRDLLQNEIKGLQLEQAQLQKTNLETDVQTTVLQGEIKILRQEQTRLEKSTKEMRNKIDDAYLRLKVASGEAGYAISHIRGIRLSIDEAREKVSSASDKLPSDVADVLDQAFRQFEFTKMIAEITEKEIRSLDDTLETIPASEWATKLYYEPGPAAKYTLISPDGAYYHIEDRRYYSRKECIAPGSLDTSLSHAAGLSDIAVCHA